MSNRRERLAGGFPHTDWPSRSLSAYAMQSYEKGQCFPVQIASVAGAGPNPGESLVGISKVMDAGFVSTP